MKAKEARQLVYDLLDIFFAGASVQHAKQSNTVKAPLPLVTLTIVSSKWPLFPPEEIINGVPVAYYPRTLALQIDLYTRGAVVEQKPGYIAPMENTALNDLIAFTAFAASHFAINWCHQHDISLTLSGQVLDTSELINDTSYQFRATTEAVLHFTDTVVGYAGILGENDPTFTPSASGGGSEELAKESIGYFTEAEIKHKQEDDYGKQS